jgi:hypothetical protein
MLRAGALRLTALAGLATATAAVAHGGFAPHPVWVAAALAAAMLALACGGLAWRAVTRSEADLRALPLPALAAALLAAQLAAHAGLGMAGAPSHAEAGSLALHLVLALLAAVLVSRIERSALARRERRDAPLQEAPAYAVVAPSRPAGRTPRLAAQRAPPLPA